MIIKENRLFCTYLSYWNKVANCTHRSSLFTLGHAVQLTIQINKCFVCFVLLSHSCYYSHSKGTPALRDNKLNALNYGTYTCIVVSKPPFRGNALFKSLQIVHEQKRFSLKLYSCVTVFVLRVILYTFLITNFCNIFISRLAVQSRLRP